MNTPLVARTGRRTRPTADSPGFFSICLQHRAPSGYRSLTDSSSNSPGIPPPVEVKHSRSDRRASGGSKQSVMKSTFCKRLRRIWIGALIAFSFPVFAVSGTAWAGCSHLVVSRSDRLLDLNRLDTFIVGNSDITSLPHLPGEPAQPAPGQRLPCSGLSCSSDSPVPCSTASQGLDDPDHWGALSAAIFRQPVAPSGIIADRGSPSSRGRKLSIFHPPRD